MASCAQFLHKVRESLDSGSFVKITLSEPQNAGTDLRNVYVRLVNIRGEHQLSVLSRYATRDVTKNFPPPDALERIEEILKTDFRRGRLFTTSGDWEFRRTPDGQERLKAHRPTLTQAPDLEHDRAKVPLIANESRWLHLLGITNATGAPRPGMADKLRQIQRFVELLSHLVDDSPLRDVRELCLLDMGSGKGSLTFAAYEFFRMRNVAIHATGVEIRNDLVELTNRAAKDVGFENLRFVQGAISDIESEKQVDILIALHACNTATDDAIHHGICAGASLIVTAPCCHKEVRPQLSPPPVIAPVLRHGILCEREAEIVTDAIRALLLEIHGYKSSVFEFVSPEHTSKNLMITGSKRPQPISPAPLREKLRALMDFYGVKEQHLARLLREI